MTTGQSSRALTACYSMHHSDNDDTRESYFLPLAARHPHRGGLRLRGCFSSWASEGDAASFFFAAASSFRGCLSTRAPSSGSP